MKTKSGLYPGTSQRRKDRSIRAMRIATQGEDIAAGFLEGASYKILTRNFRVSRVGEIDIIALDPNGVLVFVEVKTRSAERSYGIPELGFEAVGYIKQKKIRAAAEVYLQQREEMKFCRRFDVVVILMSQDCIEPIEICHVLDAFR